MTSAEDIAGRVDWKGHAQRLARVLTSGHIKLLELAWENERERFPVLGSFDLKDPNTVKALKRLAGKRIVGISETTHDEVRSMLEQAIAGAGKIPGTDEIARRFREISELAPKDDTPKEKRRAARRARIISQTETAQAMTQGSLLSWEESGVVKEVEWLTTEDELTDDICADLNGKRVKLGEDFDGYMPPAHPGCRCAVIPVVD